MDCAVCTLFENHYHFGVAVLTNSLFLQGYRGIIYAGYKGELPDWCAGAQKKSDIPWPGASVLDVTAELKIYLLPLDTSYHLSNYKPDFIMQLWDGLAKGKKRFFYFDPDITLSQPWFIFQQWADAGVALSEDINSPLSQFHPRRSAWRNYFKEKGLVLQFKEAIYANSGFIGIAEKDSTFLSSWKTIQEAIAPLIGGLNRSPFLGKGRLENNQGKPHAPFSKTDQDALNAAVELWPGPVSFMGKDMMGFMPGEPIMPHAVGTLKPWQKNFIASALKGVIPTVADKEYWLNVSGPVRCYSNSVIKFKRYSILLAAFIGRFYSKK